MSQGYVVPLDPAELAQRFADPFEVTDDGDPDEPDTDSVAELFALQDRIADLHDWLDKIPPAEADAVELLLAGKRQAEIAVVFGVTQAAISYRVNRALERLRYLSEMPDLTTDLKIILPEVITDPTTQTVVRKMWEITSQSHVAADLELGQGQVRHRFLKAVVALEKAADADPRFETLAKALRKLTRNWNILQEVRIPRIL